MIRSSEDLILFGPTDATGEFKRLNKINLKTMKQKDKNANLSKEQNSKKNSDNLTGNLLYPTKEDICSKWKEEKNVKSEKISQTREPYTEDETSEEKNLLEDISGDD